jgi:hypothetical protein
VVAETRRRAGRGAAQAVQWAGLVDTMSLLGHARAWRETLARVAVPTLWLQGGDDPLAEPGPATALAATVRTGRSGCGRGSATCSPWRTRRGPPSGSRAGSPRTGAGDLSGRCPRHR